MHRDPTDPRDRYLSDLEAELARYKSWTVPPSVNGEPINIKQIEHDWSGPSVDQSGRECLITFSTAQKTITQLLHLVKCCLKDTTEAVDQANAVTRELAATQRQIEADRSSIAEITSALKAEIASHWGITEGRGVYEWDDDRYREEFSTALRSINAAVEPLCKMGADLSRCPTTGKELVKARMGLEDELALHRKNTARLAKLERIVRKKTKNTDIWLMFASDRGEFCITHGGNPILGEGITLSAAIDAIEEAPDAEGEQP